MTEIHMLYVENTYYDDIGLVVSILGRLGLEKMEFVDVSRGNP